MTVTVKKVNSSTLNYRDPWQSDPVGDRQVRNGNVLAHSILIVFQRRGIDQGIESTSVCVHLPPWDA